MFDTHEDLIAHYAAMRKVRRLRAAPAVQNHPDGLTGIYNPETRRWDWWEVGGNGRYSQTGSTLKRSGLMS